MFTLLQISKMINGFSSSETQYQCFAEEAEFGSVGDQYIDNGENFVRCFSVSETREGNIHYSKHY